MNTLEDRLLRNPTACFILDLITVLVTIYLWLSLTMEVMPKSIGIGLIFLAGIFIVLAWSTGSWGLLLVPITYISISFLLLHQTVRRQAK